MHMLGEYLHQQMAARGWTPAEFARRADLTRQNVYQLIDDSRSSLGRLLEQRTAHKIADALEVDVDVIWRKCLESLGVPLSIMNGGEAVRATPGREEVMGFLAGEGVDSVPDDVLMQLLRARFEKPAHEDLLGELGDLRAVQARLAALIATVGSGVASAAQLQTALVGVVETEGSAIAV